MSENIRYAVVMNNGGYMKSEYVGSLLRIELESVENVIDADLYKKKSVAERIVNEVISGNTNILTLYDDNNPPVSVIEVKIFASVV